MGSYYSGSLFYNKDRQNELYHHGIIGQRWGVRRFQNSDGSLTSAGRIRYNVHNKSKSTEETKTKERKRTYIDKDGNKVKMTKDEALKYKNKLYSDENYSTEKEDHGKKGSNGELALLAFNVARDVATLNPVGAALDVYRVGQYAAGKVKSKKYEKEREQNPIDKKTGLHLKTSEMSEKEDLKRVNPDINDFNTNSKSNCMLCTATYEMRRRGYDVTAEKASKGYMQGDVKRWFPKTKIQSFMADDAASDKKQGFKANLGLNKEYAKKVIAAIEKQPDGARGNIMFNWGSSLGGHSMIYEIRDGKMILMDGQINKVYTNPEKILKSTTAVRVMRLDNVEFDSKLVKEFCK